VVVLENISRPESEMLKKVVDLYIQTGKPVSSKALKNRYKLSVSTSNIRIIFHSLEEKEYLFKPHISAGRVPTDSGYRFYVDSIREGNLLGNGVIGEIKNVIGRDFSDLRDIMLRTSRLLGELTNYMGLMMGFFHSYGYIIKLDIIQNEGNRGFVILKLSSGMKRSVCVEFPKRYPSYVLSEANRLINERVAECPLEEAVERLRDFIKESKGLEREITECVTTEADLLFDWPYDLKYYMGDMNLSWNTTEFKDPLVLRNLVTIMGQRGLMLNIMKKRMCRNLVVTIGSENQTLELSKFSVVTQSFGRQDNKGLLGILGPTRMSYKLVLPILGRMAKELDCI